MEMEISLKQLISTLHRVILRTTLITDGISYLKTSFADSVM